MHSSNLPCQTRHSTSAPVPLHSIAHHTFATLSACKAGTAKALQSHYKGTTKAQQRHCKGTAKALQKHRKGTAKAPQRHCKGTHAAAHRCPPQAPHSRTPRHVPPTTIHAPRGGAPIATLYSPSHSPAHPLARPTLCLPGQLPCCRTPAPAPFAPGRRPFCCTPAPTWSVSMLPHISPRHPLFLGGWPLLATLSERSNFADGTLRDNGRRRSLPVVARKLRRQGRNNTGD